MTISGIHVTVALGLLAAIGGISRASPRRRSRSATVELNPSVRQSRMRRPITDVSASMAVRTRHAGGSRLGGGACSRTTTGVLHSHPKPTWHAVSLSPRLARSLSSPGICKNENYAWARPALLAAKLWRVEWLAGQPTAKGHPGSRTCL